VNDVSAAAPAPAPAAPPPAIAPQPAAASWLVPLALLALAIVAVAALALAWRTQQRVQDLEQELVRRQQDTQVQATEARTLARQAQEAAREAVTKSSLLEGRVAEVALQRGQLEELIQSLSRSRDENLLVDIEAALRVAQQQSAITGSAEPLVATLRQADERLARYSQPRLEGVRRAIARDLDRVKAVGVADISALNIRLDEAVRMIDELPLLVAAELRKAAPGRGTAAAAGAPAASASASGDTASAPLRPTADPATWWPAARQRLQAWGEIVWHEVRSLVRVTRIDQPEAMLLAPEQAYFLRENLKLRLLNARLAVLSRQFDAAQADLQVARQSLERYFDRSSRKVTTTIELIRQVSAQARQVALPRPDDTLAALSTAAAGR
jgi:uroporphyrin-3 C-methyltransferase